MGAPSFYLSARRFSTASGECDLGTDIEAAARIAPEGDEAIEAPIELYQSALRIAESGDMLKWRRIVAGARRLVKPALKTWADQHSRTQPGTIDVLIEESMEGAAAFAPLTAVALAGVASGRPKFSNQVGLLEDILNPAEWQRGGLVIRVELPETGAFAYQALLGSVCLHVGNVRLAIELARCSTLNRKTGNSMPLWQRHDIVAWPEALGKNATKTWAVALGLSGRWPWVGEIFTDESDYQAALYAYYLTMSFIEFVERVRAKFEIPEDPVKAQWWPDVIARVVDIVTKSRSWWYHRSNDGSINYGWVLGDVKPLKKPIHCKGALGLWDVPPSVLRVIKRQLPRVNLDE
jgi:hypothetical protein